MSSTPLWRRCVETVEGALAPPLEGLVRHDVVGVGLTLANRGRIYAQRQTERFSRRLLHAFNVPAASDVNRLLAHIASVEREVRRLQHTVERSGSKPARRGPQRPRQLRPVEPVSRGDAEA